MIDDKPPCEQCLHSQKHRPEFLSKTAPFAMVCGHPSALRLNGAVWFVSIARDVCKGRRFKRR